MADLPFLQIVQCTDMHIMDPSYAAKLARHRAIIRRIPRRSWREKALQGTAPHEEQALQEFEEILPAITQSDEDWSGKTTWLLDTGDLTSFGDRASLLHGHSWLQRFETAAGSPPSLHLYGNHDAWPEQFPVASAHAIAAHRRTLRADWYPQTFPDAPFEVPIPGTNAKVQLWALNSVVHERNENIRAIGEIRKDRDWETPQLKVDPMEDLAQRIKAFDGENGSRNLRILAVHHPVCFPPSDDPDWTMRLSNADQVATATFAHAPPYRPLVHLVVSGHTHDLFPAHGALPADAATCQHNPLRPSQAQLVVGSLSQDDYANPKARYAQQFQVLRFYKPEAPHSVIVERYVWARANGLSGFKVMPGPSGDPAEEIRFSY